MVDVCVSNSVDMHTFVCIIACDSNVLTENITMTTADVPRERCPTGARSRVLVNLEPVHLAKLKAQAQKEGRTLSNMARHLIVQGMADRDSRSSSAT